MQKKSELAVREREEIVALVASFREMQKKFEREREEYYETTLSNAWDGFIVRHSGAETETPEARGEGVNWPFAPVARQCSSR